MIRYLVKTDFILKKHHIFRTKYYNNKWFPRLLDIKVSFYHSVSSKINLHISELYKMKCTFNDEIMSERKLNPEQV